MSGSATGMQNGAVSVFFRRFDEEEARVMRKAKKETAKEAVKNWREERKNIYKKEIDISAKEEKGQEGRKNKISSLDLWG